MNSIIIALNGFLMAFADSVPGVSGGTVAFIMGIYDEFISSVAGVVSKEPEIRRRSLIFLVKLGIGWVIGFALAVTILAELFTKRIYFVSSLFIGFIIFSMPAVIREEKDTLTKKPAAALFSLAGAALVVLITVLGSKDLAGIELSSPGIAEYIYLFISGAAAVSAMVLPGISGSTIMLILGAYIPVINAVRGLLKLDFSSLGILIPTGLGIVTGALLVIGLIKKALEKHRAAMVYFILGMMIGSLYAIVMGPMSLDEPQPAMTLSTFSIWGALAGGAVIVALGLLGKLKARKG